MSQAVENAYYLLEEITLPVCPKWMDQVVYYGERRLDITPEYGFAPTDQFDGNTIAQLVNLIPALLSHDVSAVENAHYYLKKITLPVCPKWMYEVVRHGERNMDIETDCRFVPVGRNDGDTIAQLVNLIPALLVETATTDSESE